MGGGGRRWEEVREGERMGESMGERMGARRSWKGWHVGRCVGDVRRLSLPKWSSQCRSCGAYSPAPRMHSIQLHVRAVHSCHVRTARAPAAGGARPFARVAAAALPPLPAAGARARMHSPISVASARTLRERVVPLVYALWTRGAKASGVRRACHVTEVW